MLHVVNESESLNVLFQYNRYKGKQAKLVFNCLFGEVEFEMKKMLLFLVFFLTSVSELVPTLSSHIARKESHVTPFHKYSETTTTVNAPSVKEFNNSKIASRFYKEDHSLFEHSNEKINPLSTAPTPYFSRESDISPEVNEGHLQNMRENFQEQKPTNIVNTAVTFPETNPVSVEDSDEETSKNLVLKLDREYTPLEIAEYIFVTGDEREFAQSIAEMLEDGEIMISRDDVILFLEAVQRELANLRGESDHNGIREAASTTKGDDLVLPVV